MTPEWLIAGAALCSAVAAIAAAVAAWYSNRVASRSHDLHRWAVHGANVHATIGWFPGDQATFELTVRNDGPGVAYGVYAEVAPASSGFSGMAPHINSSWHERFDLAPADTRVLTGNWRQHSEKRMKVGLHWTERADDGTERTPPPRWITVYREDPPSVPPREP